MAPPAGQLPPLAPGFEWQYDWSLPELAFGPVTTSLTKIILPPDFPALLQDSQGPQIGSGHKQTKARGTYACSKAARAGDKTPGAFLNNATRWPGYGCTSGMRRVIARAEPARDGVFLHLCASRMFPEPASWSTAAQIPSPNPNAGY